MAPWLSLPFCWQCVESPLVYLDDIKKALKKDEDESESESSRN